MDEEFPDLAQMPATAPDAASLQQAKGAADWASTFGKGDTNLVLRKKHNADIAIYTAQMQAAQAAHQQNELRTNKAAQDLYFRSEKLDLERKANEATLRLREQQFNNKKELLPKELAAKDAATAAANAREHATVTATALKANLDKARSDDTIGFTEFMQNAPVRPGTREYGDYLIEGRLKFPAMDHSVFQDIFKGHSGSDRDPDEALKARQAAADVAGPNSTVTTKLPGGVTITDKPVNEDAGLAKDRAFYASHLERAKNRKARAAKDEDMAAVKEADQDIADMSSKLFEVETKLKGGRVVAPDKAALAKKALEDPNASEAHKAAARRILGQ